jgi:hypothetical protein
MLGFLPLVARDSIPSSRLAWHLTLRLLFHSVLFNGCLAGILSQESVSQKLRDAIPSSEPHSNARSRQDLRPSCSTVLRMSLYLRDRRRSTIIAAPRCGWCTLDALKQICKYATMSLTSNQNDYSYMYIVPIFSRIGEHVQCTNEDNHENGLLLAARFEPAGSTACFKFKPVAPNITGCAARERHISGIVIHLAQYR